MPLTAVSRRLRAHLLDLLPLPLALLGATAIAASLHSPMALVIAGLLLYQPQLGSQLRHCSAPSLVARQAARFAILASALAVLPAVAAAANWPPLVPTNPHELLLTMGAAFLLYALLFALLRSLLQHGHFATRLAVVGPPTAVAGVATRLRENPRHLFQVVGVFDEGRPEEIRELQTLGQREWLDAIVVARQDARESCPEELRLQLQYLSAAIAVASPAGSDGEWLLLDDLDLATFTRLAAAFGQQRYGFVVTPNADHLLRLNEDPAFRESYAQADFVLLDSRFLARWLRWTRQQALRVCPGSDLTSALFEEVIGRDDRIVVIGGTPEQARRLRHRYGLRDLQQHVPPMGFIHDPSATRECLEFIERFSPFRFCLLAVGAPQQERLAMLLKERGIARGLTLCVGASLNFLTGGERRAPQWMQQAGLEWCYRLLQDPRRLAVRYLWRGPRVFSVLSSRRIGTRKRLFTLPTALPDARPHRTESAFPAIQRRTG